MSFRNFKCPLFPKPVSWLGLFLAVSYSKLALIFFIPVEHNSRSYFNQDLLCMNHWNYSILKCITVYCRICNVFLTFHPTLMPGPQPLWPSSLWMPLAADTSYNRGYQLHIKEVWWQKNNPCLSKTTSGAGCPYQKSNCHMSTYPQIFCTCYYNSLLLLRTWNWACLWLLLAGLELLLTYLYKLACIVMI